MSQKLQRRSDGAYETEDGLFAVKIRVLSGQDEEKNWFEFKSSVLAQVTRIEWPRDAPFALLPQDEARALVRLGYAIGITPQEMDAYNKAIGEGEPAAPVITPTNIPNTPPKEPIIPSWVAPPAAPVPAVPPALPTASPISPTAPPVAPQPIVPVPPVPVAPQLIKPPQ